MTYKTGDKISVLMTNETRGHKENTQVGGIARVVRVIGNTQYKLEVEIEAVTMIRPPAKEDDAHISAPSGVLVGYDPQTGGEVRVSADEWWSMNPQGKGDLRWIRVSGEILAVGIKKVQHQKESARLVQSVG